MGAFICYYGTPVIPEKKKDEVIRHMDEIMRIGGMMGIETAEMFGHKIHLLVPIHYNKKEEAVFHMNYLSDEFWEDAGFCRADCTLGSGKMGGGIFSAVLSAMYYLIELNSDTYNLVSRDGFYGAREKYIGWINYVCNAEYVDEKPYSIWKAAELLHESEYDNARIREIIYALSSDNTPLYSLIENMIVFDFKKSYMELKETESESENDDKTDIITIIKRMNAQLSTDSMPLEDYINLLCCSDEEIGEKMQEGSNPNHFLLAAVLLGRKIPTKFLAEKFGCDFWTLWEKVKPYDTGSIFLKDVCKDDVMLPAEKLSTREFLRIADEDRLYYWAPDGDITITEETQNWLAMLRQELKSISCSIETKESVVQFQRHIISTLDIMNRRFGRLFAFSSMFYEFIDHSNEDIYQASIQLLDRLIEQQQDKCLAYEKEHGQDWGYEYFVRDQSKEIKRYLAVLSNSELRSRYLWSDCAKL